MLPSPKPIQIIIDVLETVQNIIIGLKMAITKEKKLSNTEQR